MILVDELTSPKRSLRRQFKRKASPRVSPIPEVSSCPEDSPRPTRSKCTAQTYGSVDKSNGEAGSVGEQSNDEDEYVDRNTTFTGGGLDTNSNMFVSKGSLMFSESISKLIVI